jgi:hypothetical protein
MNVKRKTKNLVERKKVSCSHKNTYILTFMVTIK